LGDGLNSVAHIFDMSVQDTSLSVVILSGGGAGTRDLTSAVNCDAADENAYAARSLRRPVDCIAVAAVVGSLGALIALLTMTSV
jgi:hypothetical protein